MFPNGFWTSSRVVSGLVAVAYTVLAGMFRGGEGALRTFGFCLLPLACIWFPDAMGYFGRVYTVRREGLQPEPSGIIFFLGWLLLLAPAIAWLASRW